jgi:membrane-bound inhibitor of C-type lysozyme
VSSPPINTVVYDCGEYRFTARVGKDSAWLFLPERTVTLSHVVAASGAKYSDGSTGDAATRSAGPWSG